MKLVFSEIRQLVSPFVLSAVEAAVLPLYLLLCHVMPSLLPACGRLALHSFRCGMRVTRPVFLWWRSVASLHSENTSVTLNKSWPNGIAFDNCAELRSFVPNFVILQLLCYSFLLSLLSGR
jgi:hypothetical protein